MTESTDEVRPSHTDIEARSELARRLGILQDCKGADCRQQFGPVPVPSAP